MGGAASSLPVRRRIVGSEDAAPPEFAEFCKCLYNICSELQNLVFIAKVSAPLVLYVGHDTLSGVKVFNEPVRRNQIVEEFWGETLGRVEI